MSRLSEFVKWVARPWLDEQRRVARERFLLARQRLTGPQPPAGFRLILGKSMPRSGHHYLEFLLRQYLGGSYRYCEFYRPDRCCRCTPCLYRYDPPQNNLYFMQKSHDFRLRDNPRLAALYLVQSRSLIPQIQSSFEFHVRNGGPDTRETFEGFCRLGTSYFVRFFAKWIKEPAPNRLVVAYESLVEDPAAILARVVRFVTQSEEVDHQKIAAIAAASNFKVNAGSIPAGLRDPRLHKYFDEALFIKLETEVLENCGANAMRFHFIRV